MKWIRIYLTDAIHSNIPGFGVSLIQDLTSFLLLKKDTLAVRGCTVVMEMDLLTRRLVSSYDFINIIYRCGVDPLDCLIGGQSFTASGSIQRSESYKLKIDFSIQVNSK